MDALSSKGSMIRGMLLYGSQIGRKSENSHWNLGYFDLFTMKLYGIHESGDVATTGRIHKEVPERLRAMVIQCAFASIKGPERFQRFCKPLDRRKGAGKAKVAIARKMLTTVFVIPTRGCEYVEVDEKNTRKKLMRMARIAKEISDIDVETTLPKLSESAKEVLRGDGSITNIG